MSSPPIAAAVDIRPYVEEQTVADIETPQRLPEPGGRLANSAKWVISLLVVLHLAPW